MSSPQEVVNVSREWFGRVDRLLRSIETQIKEKGLPSKPGAFRVELTNETEETLKGVIRDIAIQHALEKAIEERKKVNEPDPPSE